MAFHGVDPGDSAIALCIVCGEYIFESEVERGEAFLGEGNDLPDHHNAPCLADFAASGKLDPDRIKYYTDPVTYYLDPQGQYFTDPASYPAVYNEKGEEEEYSFYRDVAATVQETVAKRKRMTLEEAKAFLRERAKYFVTAQNAMDQELLHIVSGQKSVPVFPCRYEFRKELPFPKYRLEGFILSPDEKKVFAEAKQRGEECKYVTLVPSRDLKKHSGFVPGDFYPAGVLMEVSIPDWKADTDFKAEMRGLRRVSIHWELGDSLTARVCALEEKADCDTENEKVKARIEYLATVVDSIEKDPNPLFSAVFPKEALGEWYSRWNLIKAGKLGELLDTFCVYVGSTYEEELFEYRYAVLASTSLAERLDNTVKLAGTFSHFREKIKAVEDTGIKEAAEVKRKGRLLEERRIIDRELGTDIGEFAEWEKKLEELKAATPPVSPRVIGAAADELRKIKPFRPEDSTYGKYASYLNFFFEVPWTKRTKDNFDLVHAEKILHKDHYGRNHAKERVLEQIALLAKHEELRRKALAGEIELTDELTDDLKRRVVLCFVGPPGGAKSSMGRSIARALGKNFHRISLGGVSDEGEITGFEETFQGSMAGRLIRAIRELGSCNGVLMLDEIDKMEKVRGNPQAALLETFDSTLKDGFVDKYLRAPFDLSEMLIITTANSVDEMLPALRDRQEIIDFPGYTSREKAHIARRHLVPDTMRYHVLTPELVEFSDETIDAMIDGWTEEAGVRDLGRRIADVCRKIVRTAPKGRVMITPKTLPQYLGPRTSYLESRSLVSEPGVAFGLAYTDVGGRTMTIQVECTEAEKSFLRPEDQFSITGQIKDVMKESLAVAITRLRKIAKDSNNEFGISYDLATKTFFHVHIAPAAAKKDGPSAGITLLTALTSAISGKSVNPEIVMTGELDLRGKILPVGGLVEKFGAAHRGKFPRVLYPQPQKDKVADILSKYPDLDQLLYIPIRDDREALRYAFSNAFTPNEL